MDGEWIEIFRIGPQTDSSGNTHNWTEQELDHAVSSFDSGKHEPPVVIGHPKDNQPAYGWVDALKRAGNVLLARLKQVAPEFAQMVKEGRFKKRSVSFYPDGSLRHVGFLGAMPPAVKGLKDIAFGEEEIAVYEYEENGTPSDTPSHEEDSMTLEEALRENERLKTQITTLETEKKIAEAKQSEFAEARTTAEAKAAKAEKDLADLKTATAREIEIRANKEIVEFVDGLIKEGKVAPAEKEKKVAALTAAAKAQSYEFAEDGSDTFGALKDAFKALPVRDELKNFADAYPKGGGGAGSLLIDVGALMKKI